MTVYVVQEPLKRDGTPVFDISPALEYGPIKVLLSHGPVSLSPQPMVANLRAELQHFSDDDYLVAIGDPTAIGIATSIAAEMNRGRVAMLKWDRNLSRYVEVRFNVYGGKNGLRE